MSCTNQIQEVRKFSKEQLLDMLRKKVLCETEGLLAALRKGHWPDISFLLSEITLIDMLSQNQLDENFSLYALQFYLNNLWEPYSNRR